MPSASSYPLLQVTLGIGTFRSEVSNDCRSDCCSLFDNLFAIDEPQKRAGVITPLPLSRPERSLSRGCALLAALCTFVAIALSRMLVAHFFASDLPFWDQWDSEGWLLLRPFQSGELTWDVLFSAHNEHRILFTRIIALALYVANNGQWDNLVSLTFNALAYALIFSAFIFALVRKLPFWTYLPLFAFFMLISCLPLAGENLISGFQNQAHFLIAFTGFGVWLATMRRPSATWVLLLCILAIASTFTLASGLISGPCFVAAAWLRWWGERAAGADNAADLPAANLAPTPSRGVRSFPAATLHDKNRSLVITLALAILVIATAAMVTMPVVAAHKALHAQGLQSFFNALAKVMSWPLPPWCVPLTWAPFVLGSLRTFNPSKRAPVDVAATVLGGWVFVQALALAYSRGQEMNEIATRYWDILVVGVPVNVYFAVRLGTLSHMSRKTVALAFATLVAIYFGALGWRTAYSFAYLQWRSTLTKIEIDHVRKFVVAGDIAELKNKPALNIPYPIPERLAMMLGDPTIRAMLPASVRHGVTLPHDNGFVVDGFYPTTSGDHFSTAIGSYTPIAGNKNTTQFSAPLSSQFPYVAVDIAGYLGLPGLTLSLHNPALTAPVEIHPSELARETWRRQWVAVPGPTFELQASDQRPDFWFAFTEPVEIGRLSMFVMRLLDNAIYMASALLVILVFATTLVWHKAQSK